jgi:4-hydroxy-tetrahydrodipicolinate reductase
MKKIAIIGASGKTGSTITKYFLENQINNHSLEYCIVSKKSKYLEKNVYQTFHLEEKKNLNFSSNLEEALQNSEIIIDFSSIILTSEIIDLYFEKLGLSGKKFIIGTTPFLKSEFQNFDKFTKKNLLFYSPNMSVLINLLGAFFEKFSSFFCENYDAEIHEIHHIHKKDSPSGTAKMLSQKLFSSKICDDEKAQISSAKISEIFGIHQIFMANKHEILEIKHQALNRDLFANGVFKIANWIIETKKQTGFFEMKDFLSF